MYPLQLKKTFIGLELKESDYKKVEGMIPTPTHKKFISSSYNQNTINLIYQIKHHIKTIKGHQFLSDIKIGIKNYLFVDTSFIDEFYINEDTISYGVEYTLKELKKAFNTSFIKYPKYVIPQAKKELYKNLIWFGAKLYYKDILNKNILLSTALKMNSYLKECDRYQYKELLKKVESTYLYITQNKDERFKKRLKPNELKKAHIKGGKIRAKQLLLQTKYQKEIIKDYLKNEAFLKSNNKPNISKIAKELNLSRPTVTKYIYLIDHNNNS